MKKPHEVSSIVDQIPAGEWSSERAASFEAALEAINHAFGAYSALIAKAEAHGADEAQISQLKAGRESCIRDREALSPDDIAAVAEIRHRYTVLTRRLRSET
ncbi:hypothetical protein [Streptomyces zhaozhouensis]|uniref:hypothetical protein n=1 Tax=Streptomyces zhaozhouensis TaxID=1300267 RepID=UPI000BE226A5|nr:hypothetical protein [Streptomyces zhaozhouensis]